MLAVYIMDVIVMTMIHGTLKNKIKTKFKKKDKYVSDWKKYFA